MANFANRTQEEWRHTTLGALGSFATSSTDKKTIPGELLVRLINYMDVYRSPFIDTATPLMRVSASLSEIAKAQVKRGDVYFTPSSETPDDIGHSAVLVDALENTLHSYHTVRFRLHDQDAIHLRFRGRFANAFAPLKHFSLRATGSTRYTLSLDDFRATPVSLPPLGEQACIAHILDTLDTAIRQTEAIIAKLKQVKQGLLHDLLTRGIDANGELRPPQSQAPHLYKPSPLGWIPKEWDVRPLARYTSSDITYGIVQAGPNIEHGVPYIRTGDMLDDGLDRASLLCTSRRIADSYKRSEVHVGDLVIAIRATVGKVLPVPADLDGANLTQGTARIAPNARTDPTFLLWAIRHHRAQQSILSEIKGTTFAEITLADLRQVPLAAPTDIQEQRQIGERLQAGDDSIRSLCRELGKLQLQKSGLMDDLLTGRVRVTPLLEAAAAP